MFYLLLSFYLGKLTIYNFILALDHYPTVGHFYIIYNSIWNGKKKLYQANNHIAYLDESDDLVITTDFCTWFTSDFYTTDDLVITNIDFYVGM